MTNGILKKIGYGGLGYIKDRATKEKISSWTGIVLVGLYVAGQITGAQLSAVTALADAFGYSIPNITDLIIGAGLFATPTSKLKRNG